MTDITQEELLEAVRAFQAKDTMKADIRIETIDDLAYSCGVEVEDDDPANEEGSGDDEQMTVDLDLLIDSIVGQQLIYIDSHFRPMSVREILDINDLRRRVR